LVADITKYRVGNQAELKAKHDAKNLCCQRYTEKERAELRRRRRKRRNPIRFFSSENRASTFRRLRSATANSGVLATSSAFCLAASQVWIAIVRNLPRVHCGFCSHPRQRLTVE